MSIMAPVAGVVQAKPIFQYNGKNIMKKKTGSCHLDPHQMRMLKGV